PAEKIVRLHSTIDPAVFFPGEAARDIDVLVSAQLRARKRPLFTLDVFRRILDDRPETRFCWLGDGPERPAFERELDRLALRDAVEWTVTDNVADYYRRARVFLLCSINEGLSLACMEAMACGVVPVTTDCGDMADVVKTGITGALVSVEAAPAEFARDVSELLRDDAAWNRQSRASAESILREHGFDSATAAWRQLLSELDSERREHTN
ncbi:MAG: glycosyltransferase family 4 protein, partial [bacterium]|nr:glycosyltransferase family 4 protein [bacterium]